MMDLDEMLPIDCQAAQQEQVRASGGSSNHISFEEYVEIELMEHISEMTEEEKDDIWYRRCELNDFKHQARKLCKTKSKGQESTRGLECYFPQRMRCTKRTNDQVLRTCWFAGDSDETGQMAEQYNAEARRLALTTGIQDFYEAYFSHIIQQSSTPGDIFEPTPLPQPSSEGPATPARMQMSKP